jgi:hypothetical protein
LNGPCPKGKDPFRQSRFSEEQVVAILREAVRGSVVMTSEKLLRHDVWRTPLRAR